MTDWLRGEYAAILIHRCAIHRGAGARLRGTVLAVLAASVALLAPGVASAERIKDVAHFAGVRSNQLVGYGIVVGLDGTGDQTGQYNPDWKNIKHGGIIAGEQCNTESKEIRLYG